MQMKSVDMDLAMRDKQLKVTVKLSDYALMRCHLSDISDDNHGTIENPIYLILPFGLIVTSNTNNDRMNAAIELDEIQTILSYGDISFILAVQKSLNVFLAVLSPPKPGTASFPLFSFVVSWV